ncbi:MULTISPECIES: arginase [Methylobacterium]|uniref:arginase n=1 Tax=Methylobacterium TaxID=407 RepID=UPI0006AE07B9|nr:MULTISPECIES: arginase [Methylobacterium]MDE3748533.1 arginase [Methylobacterium radiotolerans]PVY88953.1 arginase [Methylobacterium organophilum]RUP20821.1 MAG: arginase [Methylobacterium sp.]UIY44701.1 arginase [Methylobacterium radiotolerans]
MSGEAQPDAARSIALIGAPIEVGTSEPGALMGPAALRTAGLVRALAELGHAIADRGDVVPDGPAGTRGLEGVAAWTRAVSRAVGDALDAGALPLTAGGDHSLSLGSVDGVMRHCARRGQPVFVLWLDAHADFNTPATSPSGNVHGMPLAALCGEPGFPSLFAEPAPAPLPPAHVHLFGLRSIDAGERALVTARRVGVTDMRTIDEFGVVAPLRRVLDRVAAQGAHLHVSLDIDFLDPSIAPAVGTTVPGGATFREAHLIMEMLHDSGLVRSLDVVELNPFLDERGRSARVLVELVASLFGRRILDRPTGPIEAVAAEPAGRA